MKQNKFRDSVIAPQKKWRRRRGAISLLLTSDGTSGQEWIERLEKKGVVLSNSTKSILLSRDFQPSSGVTTEVVILKGLLWNDHNRSLGRICSKARELELQAPSIEVACLLREALSGKRMSSMGLHQIIVMHEPFRGVTGASLSLSIFSSRLYTYHRCSENGLRHDHGFAFVF